MKKIVFYSWQSDLPNACNRGFIQQALENAAATIRADDTVEVEPVVDRDTQGVPGAPDIASTIFAKITAADIFVADVSIVGREGERASPNPNVLIELGYAFKALGPERVILVFNRAFGKIEELPFDLRMRRVVVFDMPLEAEQRATERRNLEKQLDSAVRAALPTTHEPSPLPIAALSAIEARQPNRIVILRRDLDRIFKELDVHQPKKVSQGGTVDELTAALTRTQATVAEFSKIAEIVSLMSDAEAALEITRWFGRIFERYDLPENHAGRFSDADFDHFRFLGHELLTTYAGFLLREQRWDILKSLTDEPIPARHLHREHGPANVEWSFASQPVLSLYYESRTKGRVSLHADMLKQRHTAGGLAVIMPFEDFIPADYLLFLIGEIPPDTAPGLVWRPWSALYLRRSPLFLRTAEFHNSALRLMNLCRISSLQEFKKRLIERTPILEKLFQGAFWASPLEQAEIERIGSR
jgi:hypothetical protein